MTTLSPKDGKPPLVNRLRIALLALAGISFIMILLFLPRQAEFNPEKWKTWSRAPDDCLRYGMSMQAAGTIQNYVKDRAALTGLYGEPDRVGSPSTGDGQCLIYDLGQCGIDKTTPQELRVCFDGDGKYLDVYMQGQ